MGSSRKSSDQILGVISRRRAERLLTDWVNLHFIRDPHGKILENRDGGESAVVRMVSHYPEVFRDFEPSDHFSKLSLIALLLTVRDALRSVWNAQDIRHREWYLFILRQTFHHGIAAEKTGFWRPDEIAKRTSKSLSREQFQENFAHLVDYGETIEAPPPITPFEAAVFYLQRICDRAIRCGNPTCPAPYFIALKKSQRYCSEQCAGDGTRESKRRWWNENRAKNGGLQ